MKYIYLPFCLFFFACSTSSELPRLNSISDEVETGNNVVHAYIQLHRDEPNLISIWAWQKFDEFVIYRNDSSYDEFEKIYSIDLKKPDTHPMAKLVTVFHDTSNSNLDSRYKIYPVINNSSGDKLPIIYATSDTSYYRQMEKINFESN